MSSLIRAARIAPMRARLSEMRTTDVEAQPAATPVDPFEAMRQQLAAEIRSELTAELHEHLRIERERAASEGHADGFAQGTQAARSEAELTRQELRNDVQSALTALEQAHRGALEQLEANVWQLAFAAVCRLVSAQATTQSFVLQLVRNVCADLRGDSIADVRLHPRDVELLRDLADGSQQRIGALGLNVIADESLRLGGCIVEAPSGRYDGSLETQLSRLHAVLSAVRPTRDEEG